MIDELMDLAEVLNDFCTKLEDCKFFHNIFDHITELFEDIKKDNAVWEFE